MMMEVGDLIRCVRSFKVGLIIDIATSSDYRYPEIIWLHEPDQIKSRGFETLELYDGKA
jgi:hypothetical protein